MWSHSSVVRACDCSPKGLDIAGPRVRITLGPLFDESHLHIVQDTSSARLLVPFLAQHRTCSQLPTMNFPLRLAAAFLAVATAHAASLSVQNPLLTVTGTDASQLRSES